MSEAREVSPTEILDRLSVAVFEPPLSRMREDGRIRDLANPVAVIMLIIDFETEISMNGIQGFIGNSTGLHAPATVKALRGIGCDDAATTLVAILETAEASGMTHDAIQRDRGDVEEYTVTTFRKLHGSKWDRVNDEINVLADQIDLDRVLQNAASFIQSHKDTFVTALSSGE